VELECDSVSLTGLEEIADRKSYGQAAPTRSVPQERYRLQRLLNK